MKQFQPFLNQLASNPKRLFLVDSLGALLTAVMLGLVLASFETVFGMSQKPLRLLAMVAFLFAAYSVSCYLWAGKHWRPTLKLIALGNLAYCCLMMGFVYHHYSSLTILGLVYFLVELLIIAGLAMIELRAVAHPVDNTHL